MEILHRKNYYHKPEVRLRPGLKVAISNDFLQTEAYFEKLVISEKLGKVH